jgi:DinB superfamily
MTDSNSNEQIFVTTAIKAWDVWIARIGKFFDSLTDEQIQAEIAPGKNRPIYLLGHLIAVHDSMIPQLRLGEAAYPELREIFIVKADRAVEELPPTAELRQIWKDLNARLAELFQQLTPAQWLERHSTISEEDFAKEPHRNRLAILLSRTSHASYHLGQLMFLPK